MFWKVLLEDSGGVQEPAGLLRATKRGEVAADALVEHALAGDANQKNQTAETT